MKITLSLFCILAYSSLAFSICQKWSKAKQVGTLDGSMLNEASGLAISKLVENRLFHINDSGDGPFIYLTQKDGKGTQKVSINGFLPFDVESLAYGKCGEDHCLIVGDIGDNKKVRETVSLVVVKDRKQFPDAIDPLHINQYRYPDGAKDAESLAIHPQTQDLYLMAKTPDFINRKILVSGIYKITAEQWQKPQKNIVTMERIGEIDLDYINFQYEFYGRLATGMDISPSGRSLLVLTYTDAILFNIDLSKNKIKPTKEMELDKDYQFIYLSSLPQQEAIAFNSLGSGFWYSTELKKNHQASLMQVECKKGEL